MFSPGCGDERDHLSGAVATGAALTTAAGTRQDEPAAPAERSWRLALLAETEPGRRNRRTIDSAFLLVAAIVIGASPPPGLGRNRIKSLIGRPTGAVERRNPTEGSGANHGAIRHSRTPIAHAA